MTKKKSTKRALISSLLILAMCFTMLAGTTFAWFTDETSSIGNRIVAGKLDVDLVMDKAANGTYESIADGQGDIFKEYTVAQNSTETLWEPGKTQFAFLGVENKGNLAAKYNLLLNVVDGGLIGSLEYAVLDGKKASDIDFDSNWAAVAAQAQVGDVAAGVQVAAPNGKLAVGATDYFVLAIHMKEDAGNQYQEKDVTIDIKLVATQAAVEEDAFDETYDANAELPTAIFPVANATDLATAIAEADDGDIIQVTDDIPSEITVDNGKAITIDLGEKTVGALRITDGDVTLQNGTISGGSQGVNIYNDSHLVIASDATIDAQYGVIVRDVNKASDSVVDVRGTIHGNLFVMGNIEGGASVVNVYGTIDSTGVSDIGIALNGAATVNVYDGAVITGDAGIEVRAGNLNVYGGTITGTAKPNYTVPNGSGTTTVGAGIAVAQHTTKLPINVNIEGGAIKGYVALLEINPQNNSATDLDKINIVVKGGTFEAINGGDPAWKISIVDQGIVHYTNYTL